MDLASKKCEVCQAGAPAVEGEELKELLSQIPNWRVLDEAGVKKLERVFKFKDFAAALVFTNALGAAVEAEGHHPAILIEWGKVTVRWWTHKIGGLHQNDFVMAAKTDRLYSA